MLYRKKWHTSIPFVPYPHFSIPLPFSYWCFLHWIFTISSSSTSPLSSLPTHGNTYRFPLHSVVSPWGCLLHPLSPSSFFHWFSSASSPSSIHFLSVLYPYLHSLFDTLFFSLASSAASFVFYLLTFSASTMQAKLEIKIQLWHQWNSWHAF